MPQFNQLAPEEDPSYTANSLAMQTGIDYSQQAGFENSSVLTAMSQAPGIAVTTGWNALRGQNTILKGGFTESGALARPNILPRIFGKHATRVSGSNPFGPRSWTRMSSQDMLYEGEHSPVDTIAGPANWIGNKVMGAIGTDGKLAEKLMNANIMPREIAAGEKRQDLFSRGFLSRMSAAQRVSRGGGNPASIMKFVNKDPVLGKALGGAGAESISAEQMSHYVAASGKGTVSQYVGGYLRGAVTGAPDAATAGKLVGKEAYLSGAEAVGKSLGGAGLKVEGGVIKAAVTKGLIEEGTELGMGAALKFGGVKAAGGLGARAVGMAIPGVNVVLGLMMAYDFAKMGTSLLKGGVKSAQAAAKSFKGSIEKGVMGMGYRDTTVAATSRQRGVMAIQNSRLNMRSVLGSEGSLMASHFGGTTGY